MHNGLEAVLQGLAGVVILQCNNLRCERGALGSHDSNGEQMPHLQNVNDAKVQDDVLAAPFTLSTTAKQLQKTFVNAVVMDIICRWQSAFLP